MLQVSDVAKRYGARTVLEAVSFVVNPGERLPLVGPNGCGKTTLVRVIAAVHDRYFIRQLGGRVWAIERGRLVNYVDVDDWEMRREVLNHEAHQE